MIIDWITIYYYSKTAKLFEFCIREKRKTTENWFRWKFLENCVFNEMFKLIIIECCCTWKMFMSHPIILSCRFSYASMLATLKQKLKLTPVIWIYKQIILGEKLFFTFGFLFGFCTANKKKTNDNKKGCKIKKVQNNNFIQFQIDVSSFIQMSYCMR